MAIELPSPEDNEAAEDILIQLGILRVLGSSDHIRRYTAITDPKEDKESVIAEVADIIRKRVKKAIETKFPPMPPCYRCNGSRYVTYFDASGHDWDGRCPVCNTAGLERYD